MNDLTINRVDSEFVDLTIPLNSDTVGCRLNLRVRQEIVDGRHFRASIMLDHNIRGQHVRLIDETIDPDALKSTRHKSMVEAIRIAFARDTDPESTLDAIQNIINEGSSS